MSRTTPVKLEIDPVRLDTEARDLPMSFAAGISYLRSQGVNVSRATLFRWNAAELEAGRPPLMHQPTGERGRLFIVPAEIMGYIKSRCSDSTPAREVAS
jgi:hypothetical protein